MEGDHGCLVAVLEDVGEKRERVGAGCGSGSDWGLARGNGLGISRYFSEGTLEGVRRA